MGSLVAMVIGWGVPAKMAKPFIVLIAIALAVALFFGAKAIYDHSIISTHDTKVEAQQARDDRKADNSAAEQRRVDDARAGQEKQELNNVLNNQSATPEQRRRDFYACIRLQQRARANGLEPPTCV